MYGFTVQDEIKLDPTLDYFLNKATLDYNKMEHQLNLQRVGFLIALKRYLDKVYR